MSWSVTGWKVCSSGWNLYASIILDLLLGTNHILYLHSLLIMAFWLLKMKSWSMIFWAKLFLFSISDGFNLWPQLKVSVYILVIFLFWSYENSFSKISFICTSIWIQFLLLEKDSFLIFGNLTCVSYGHINPQNFDY